MGYINLTGDSNGDLHDAEMHNAKFGAIASVLNGNIDSDNLAAPQSVFTWSFGTGFGGPITGTFTDGAVDTNVLRIGSDKTTGSPNVSSWDNLNSTEVYFMMIESVKKAPFDMTLAAVDAVIYQQNGTLADNYQLILQSGS